VSKGYVPGCIGRIAELHAVYYAEHAGFGVFFESKVARELGAFCENYQEERDGLWVVKIGDTIQGSIVIDGSKAGIDGAHLRWFIMSDVYRGAGYGNALLSTAVEFCRIRNYNHVYLWTFHGLDAAGHLYRKFGFKIAAEHHGTQWGREVIEQRYERNT
jgi:GNAT superfamily N-acetyltransferase